MSKTSTLNLSVTVSGDGLPAGQAPYVPTGIPSVNNSAPGGGPQQLTLAAGDNTIVIPTGALWFLYVPPVGSTNIKQYRSAAGVAGPNAPGNSPLLGFISAGANIVLNSTNPETGQIFWG